MIRTISCCLLAFGCWLATCAAASDDLPKVRKVNLKYNCEIAEVPPGAKSVDLWIPIPSDNERQTVRLLNANDLTAGRMTTDKKFGNRLYYQRFEAKAGDSIKPIKIELLYDAEVREASVPEAKKLVATKQIIPSTQFAPYLGNTKMIPIQGRITELARGINIPENDPLLAGRKIYDYLIDTMVYDYKAPGAGVGNAVWACDSKTGDCSDYSSVFIGICRSKNIPADHVFGLPMPPEQPEGDIRYCHCWARFYVPDVGWVPIDASRADKFPKDRDYYFGTLSSTWLILAHGRDVVLEPPQKGEPLNILHGPVVEVDGQPFEGVKWLAHYQDKPEARAAK